MISNKLRRNLRLIKKNKENTKNIMTYLCQTTPGLPVKSRRQKRGCPVFCTRFTYPPNWRPTRHSISAYMYVEIGWGCPPAPRSPELRRTAWPGERRAGGGTKKGKNYSCVPHTLSTYDNTAVKKHHFSYLSNTLCVIHRWKAEDLRISTVQEPRASSNNVKSCCFYWVTVVLPCFLSLGYTYGPNGRRTHTT